MSIGQGPFKHVCGKACSVFAETAHHVVHDDRSNTSLKTVIACFQLSGPGSARGIKKIGQSFCAPMGVERTVMKWSIRCHKGQHLNHITSVVKTKQRTPNWQ